MSSSLLLCATFQTLIALRGQFTFHSLSQQVGEMGVGERTMFQGGSQGLQGKEKAMLRERLKSRRYKQEFLLAASLCLCVCVYVCVCVWAFCFSLLLVECTCTI